MDTNESNLGEPVGVSDHGDANDQESPALGPFVLAVGECAELIARLKERLDEHLGVSPDGVTWGHVADADRLLYHLRHAAFVAEVGEEPAS